MKKVFVILCLLLSSPFAMAEEKPWDGKAFFPWLWEDQFKPTIVNSWDSTGQKILLMGAASTVFAHQYDDQVANHNDRKKRVMDPYTANIGGFLGSGGPGIAIAVMQLYFDTDNGLQHSRALALTAANHILIASLVQRERPNERDYLSFPSGHTSSSFASATSLAYSYGWKVGVPAFAAATFIGITRISENIHWTSDVVAAAALGIYWGRASALQNPERTWTILPMIQSNGAFAMFQAEF